MVEIFRSGIHRCSSSLPRPSSTRRAGLTLVELLVVIGIIIALAAILFPVVRTGIARAHSTTCANNLAQIGKATLLYAADHDNHFPNRFTIDVVEGNRAELERNGTLPAMLWFKQVERYGVTREILLCPATPKGRDDYSPLASVHPLWFTSYEHGILLKVFLERATYNIGAIPDLGKIGYMADVPWPGSSPRYPRGPHLDYRFNILHPDGSVSSHVHKEP